MKPFKPRPREQWPQELRELNDRYPPGVGELVPREWKRYAQDLEALCEADLDLGQERLAAVRQKRP